MKILLCCSLIICFAFVQAQSPHSFKYQAVLRDNGGLPLIEKNITVKINILQGSLTGLSAYSEVHQAKTSPVGVVNLEIGKGTQNTGNFTTISWGTNTHFVKIEIDPMGGSNFEQVGTSQLMSVPYALYSEKSGDEKWGKVNSDISYLGGNVGIGTSNPTVKLDVEGVNAAIQLSKAELKSSESDGKGRIDFKSDQTDLSNAYLTSLNRIGDLSEDLIFGLQQPIGNTTSWNILESWRGAGLMVSSSGTEQKPLLFGIDRLEKMRIDGSGNVGIGTINPKSKLQVESGDVFINSIDSGLIMKSPNGNCWRMSVDNSGNPVFSSITCP